RRGAESQLGFGSLTSLLGFGSLTSLFGVGSLPSFGSGAAMRIASGRTVGDLAASDDALSFSAASVIVGRSTRRREPTSVSSVPVRGFVSSDSGRSWVEGCSTRRRGGGNFS